MRCLCVVIALSVLTACGGSPTGPERVPPSVPTPVATPSGSDPAPTPPAPAPPAPTPPAQPNPDPPTTPPNPAPPPPATDVVTYHGTVTSAHWYGSTILPDQFDVRISDGRIVFGPLTADVVLQDARSLFARPDGATLQLWFDGAGGGSWAYTGKGGQASGTLVK